MSGTESTRHPSSRRLLRTAHTEEGISVFTDDSYPAPFYPFGPQGGFVVFDVRQKVPVNNNDPIPSFAETLPRCSPTGAVFCMSEIQPGGGSPMHRTQSIDYGMILSGEIVLALDGGEEKTMKAGDVIVQQGVNHRWINRSDAPCQLLFVMLGAEKMTLKDGTVLEEDVFKKE
ncbi:hypothetical protein BGZ63DRAFT_412257 [Mariannaea sp. PMI_226]|nr:hypothetical protein BGZ63DRAFT_412257 [Mariannaea sp. PMI_226]